MFIQAHLQVVHCFLQQSLVASKFIFCISLSNEYGSEQFLKDVLARSHPKEGVVQVKVLINSRSLYWVTWIPVVWCASCLRNISHDGAVLAEDEALTCCLVDFHQGGDLFRWIYLCVIFAHVFSFEHLHYLDFMWNFVEQAEASD